MELKKIKQFQSKKKLLVLIILQERKSNLLHRRGRMMKRSGEGRANSRKIDSSNVPGARVTYFAASGNNGKDHSIEGRGG